jgi:large subunit ribosomal protein L24
MYIRKNDDVMVIAGKAKGQRGKVLRIDNSKSRVVIEKVNLVKRHQKATQTNPTGGIISKEAPIHASNVNLFCEKCKGPVRVASKKLEDGTKVRVCKGCGETIEAKQ